MVAQIIECYQFSCHFAVTQNRKEKKMALLLGNKPYQNILSDCEMISKVLAYQDSKMLDQLNKYSIIELVDESQLKEA